MTNRWLCLLAALILAACPTVPETRIEERDIRSAVRFEAIGDFSAYINEAGECIMVVGVPTAAQYQVVFSKDGDLLYNSGLNLIEHKDYSYLVGRSFKDAENILGKEHANIGSGFSYPLYITSDGCVLLISFEGDLVSRAELIEFVKDYRAHDDISEDH